MHHSSLAGEITTSKEGKLAAASMSFAAVHFSLVKPFLA
jgi:hypothetical protein